MPLLLAFQSAITPVTAGFIQGVDGVWLRHGKGGDVGRLDPRDNDVFTFYIQGRHWQVPGYRKSVVQGYDCHDVNLYQTQSNKLQCQTANVRSSAAEHKIGWDYDKKKFVLGECGCNRGPERTGFASRLTCFTGSALDPVSFECKVIRDEDC